MQQASYHTLLSQMPPSPGIDHARMDDINYLRYRNVELETELRLVKEQLAQAQSGTQYLLTCLAGSSALNPHTSANSVERQLHFRQDDSRHLRPRLDITNSSPNYIYGPNHLTNDDTTPRRYGNALKHSTSLNHQLDVSKAPPSPEDDLLTFDGHGPSPVVTEVQSPPRRLGHKIESTPTSIPRPLSPVAKSSSSNTVTATSNTVRTKLEGVGLGIQNVHADNIERHDSPIDGQREYVFNHNNQKVAGSVQAPFGAAPNAKGVWTSIHAPPLDEPELVFDRAFLDGEHNRLLNSACFIEDMTGEDREQHWVKLEREKGRHSAREWKLYYEKVILPAYRAKIKVEEATDSATPVDRDEKTAIPECKSSLVPDKTSPEAAATTSVRPPLDKQYGTSSISEVQDRAFPIGLPETVSKYTAERNIDQNNISETPTLEHSVVVPNLPHLADDSGVESTDTPSSINNNNTAAKMTSPALPESSPSNNGTPVPTFNSTSSRFLSPPPRFRPPMKPKLGRHPQFHVSPTEFSHVRHNPSAEQPAQVRTILISNIPSGTTLAKVLSGVRGGTIVKASFQETRGMKTKPPITTNSAMIEFLNASDAAVAVENGVQLVSTSPHEDEPLQLLGVHLLQSPSRPLHPKLEVDMQEHGLTRTICITAEGTYATTDSIMDRISERYPYQKKPLEAGKLQDGRLYIEFADVRDAASAWEVMKVDSQGLRALHRGFLPDPWDVEVAAKAEVTECTSGSDADDEDDRGSMAIDTPAASFEDS